MPDFFMYNTVYNAIDGDELTFSIENDMLPYIEADQIFKERYYNSVENMTKKYEEINKNAEVKTYKITEEQNRRLDETWIKI